MFRGKFKYGSSKPLPRGHIRLLTLYPGSEDSRIKCRLEPAVLSQDPVFEALSYVWGRSFVPGIDTTISLNDKKFVVRPNLWRALKHLRYLSNERVLWIDAICIDQDDQAEKAIQIEQMGRVYSEAATVVLWLGLASKDSEIALEFLQRLSTEPSITDEEITSSLFPAGRLPVLVLALREILGGRFYWCRLWILQEVVLGRKDIVLCFGHDRMSWDILGVGIIRLRRYLRSLPTEPGAKGYQNDSDLRTAVDHGFAASLYNIRLMKRPSPQLNSVSSPPTGNPLRYILGLAQNAQCYKVHDKIYGLLGMTDFNMPVDYDRDMFDLYAEALHYFRNALISQPQDPHEIYTARLGQLFQKLLKGPFPLKSRDHKLPCVGMSGILSCEIVQIGRGTRPSIQIPDAADQSMNISESLEEEKEHLEESLWAILLWFKKSTGYNVTKPDDKTVSDFSGSPKRNLVLPCIPHYFRATRKSISKNSEIYIPGNVPQIGSVPAPTTNSLHPFYRSKPQLFVASRQQKSLPLVQANEDNLHPIIGFATPDAQIGDHIVRFLETDVCLVIRDSGAGEYVFVGCAIIPIGGDISADLHVHDRAWKIDHSWIYGSAPSYTQFQRVFQDAVGDTVDVVIDVETLQFITNVGFFGFGH